MKSILGVICGVGLAAAGYPVYESATGVIHWGNLYVLAVTIGSALYAYDIYKGRISYE